MKTYLELQKQIKGGEIKNLYLFHGPEQYLAKKLLKEIETFSFAGTGVQEFNHDTFDGDRASLQNIIGATITLPVFSDKRLVVVNNAPWFASKKNENNEKNTGGQEELLLEYIANPSPTTVLVFFVAEVDKRKKLYREIKKTGVTWESNYLKGQDLRSFINSYLRNKGKTIDRNALETIVSNQQQDLQFLEIELEKLINYLGIKENITRRDVDEIFYIPEDNTIFDLTDAVGTKQTGTALGLLRKMFKEGVDIHYILSMLVFQLRLILRTKALLLERYTEDQILAEIGGHPYPITKALRQSRNFDIEDLIFALEKLLEADVTVKSGRGEIKTVLEQTVFELCS